jgi:acyl carrier protein
VFAEHEHVTGIPVSVVNAPALPAAVADRGSRTIDAAGVNVHDLHRTIRNYIIAEYLDEGDSIDGSTPLITGGIVDSFSMVSLKCFLERTYGIIIPDAQATPAAFDSVDKIAELVSRLRARTVSAR